MVTSEPVAELAVLSERSERGPARNTMLLPDCYLSFVREGRGNVELEHRRILMRGHEWSQLDTPWLQQRQRRCALAVLALDDTDGWRGRAEGEDL